MRNLSLPGLVLLSLLAVPALAREGAAPAEPAQSTQSPPGSAGASPSQAGASPSQAGASPSQAGASPSLPTVPIASVPGAVSDPGTVLPPGPPIRDSWLPNWALSFLDVLTQDRGSPFTVSGEYLIWRLQPGPLPLPLVTTGNPNSPTPGALGQAGTQVLFGDNDLSRQPTSGFRGMIGYWLDPDQTWKVEGGGFMLQEHHTVFQAGGDASGNPPLYVPVYRDDLAEEGSVVISDPLGGGLGPFPGSVLIQASTSLWGAECNAVGTLYRGDRGGSLSLVVGYRYLDLTEHLQMNVNQNAPEVGIQTGLFDRFATRNQFNGEQTGLRAQAFLGPVTLDLAGTIALGVTNQKLGISGGTVIGGAGAGTPGLPPAGSFPGGIFTAPSNIGTQSHTPIAAVPQVQAKLGVRLSNWARVFVGYDFLAWSSVVRPGDQIDRMINGTQQQGGMLIGPASPTPLFATSAFWAQGITMGFELRF